MNNPLPVVLSSRASRAEPDRIRHWVIYRNPSDYPGKFVVREWTIAFGDNPEPTPSATVTAIKDTIDEARTFVPNGYVNIGRMQNDDPAIFEVWI
jgi:hypothetical protein